MNRQFFFRRRLARWGLGLLGGLLLLVGLILNAKAQAPPGMVHSRIHTFRPVFDQGAQASGNLHPAVELTGFQKPANLYNPTAHGDAHGLYCLSCHSSQQAAHWSWKPVAGFQLAGWPGETGLSLECESCHSGPAGNES